MSSMAEHLPDDPALLKALIAALQAGNAQISATLRAPDHLIQTLRARIAKLRKQVFGQSSEKIEREIAQLELALEDLMVATAESSAAAAEDAPEVKTIAEPDTEDRPTRRRPRVSADTPRERQELDPGSCCPDCGGDLRLVGEDTSEMLDLVAAQLKVVQIARLKKSCRRCEHRVQPPAPSRPIPGSMAGAGLLAHVLVSKFDDHLPLYRQNEIFARMGADIPDSTLVDWCGRAMRVLQPLIDRIEMSVMASDLLHADDTPIRVLDRSLRDRGLGKGVKKGRIWAYVRDQRPWSGSAPPGVTCHFAPDWKEEHVRHHLRRSSGMPHRQMATRATPSSTFPNRTAARPASARPRAGRICDGTSMTSGNPPNPRSPAQPLIGSGRSTTSSATSPVRLPRRAMRPARR